MSESAVRAYAAERRFAAALLGRWLAQAPADRDALLDLATQLRLGENQLRDVLDDLTAISARRGCDIAAVVHGDELRAVRARPLGRNEAVKAVKHALHQLRFPQLTAAEQRLAELGKSLRLPAGARLVLPEHLEGEHIGVTLQARSPAELRAQAGAVAAALENGALDEMFAVLGGEW
jgi:hypothetical protein